MPASVSPEDFVRSWQESQTIEELCSRTGLSLATAKDRARLYRSRGVPLKIFPRKRSGRPGLNVEQLSEIAERALKAG